MAELAGRRAMIVGADEIGCGIGARFARESATIAFAEQPSEITAFAPDILVLNPLGAAAPAPLDNQSPAAFDTALASIKSAALCLQAAAPSMRARQWGRIVLVGDRYGDGVNDGIAAYNVAASALMGLIRSAAVEWGRFGIATNLLVPFADTAELRAARERRPKIIDLFLSQIPLRRAGDPVEDIGGAALYLASEDAAFINGQVVYADGGQHVAGPVLSPIRFQS